VNQNQDERNCSLLNYSLDIFFQVEQDSSMKMLHIFDKKNRIKRYRVKFFSIHHRGKMLDHSVVAIKMQSINYMVVMVRFLQRA
jgi:hypothetical protein